MSAAQGLECRLLSGNVVIAMRRRLLQAQRNDTPRCFPDALVTGVIPASAAIASGGSNASRASPAAARGKDRHTLPSGWIAIFAAIEWSRSLIAVLSAVITPAWSTATRTPSDRSGSVTPAGAERRRHRQPG